jgi:hypothetical protein
MKITLRLLKRLEACGDALEFFEKSKLEGFDSDWIKAIPKEIKFNGYIEWLSGKFSNACKIIQDNDNNKIIFEYSSGYSWTRTYDENNNVLTYENSDGYSSTKTYDENNNVLTFKDSRGYSWISTYDENNNELTYEDSSGYSWAKTYNNELTFKDSDSYAGTYDKDGRLLSITENNVTFNIPWGN